MLVFAAIVPHPPILIPNIGKDNRKKLKKTIAAFDILENELNATNPDGLIVISPHGDISVENFTINTNQNYKADFQNFGDFETRLEFKSDLQFINELKSQNEADVPLHLLSEDNLDHGVSVPLYFLTRKNQQRRIVPITYSFQSYKKHLEFGEALKEAIYSLDKRYAVIASGDLSHRLSLQSPNGFSPQAKEFDKKLIQLLKKRNTEAIMTMDQKLIEDAGECGLRSIMILLGVIKDMNYEFQVLSYESPFGVGYLVGEFRLA